MGNALSSYPHAHAVRIEHHLDGKIVVAVLDNTFVHKNAFWSDKFKSVRTAGNFLKRHGWVPEFCRACSGEPRGVLPPKRFRLLRPKKGESTTTWFETMVQTRHSWAKFDSRQKLES